MHPHDFSQKYVCYMTTHALLSAQVSLLPHTRVPLKAGQVSPGNSGFPSFAVLTSHESGVPIFKQ